MPSAPCRLAGFLCLVSNAAFSMRTRPGATLLDDMPSNARVSLKSSTRARKTSDRSPQCFWNNATDMCQAFVFVRPEGASDTKCSPYMRDYRRLSYYTRQTLPESTCKSTTGKYGTCSWDSNSATCAEPLCDNMRDQASCLANPMGCEWEGNYSYCSNRYCYDRKDEADCLSGNCDWHGSYCSEISCYRFRDRSGCIAGTQNITKYPWYSKHYQAPTCWWDDTDKWRGGDCMESRGCQDYRSEAGCAADPAQFGGCAWNPRFNGCMKVNSCDDYDTYWTCNADPLGVAQKMAPGTSAQCHWEGGSYFTVGTALSRGLFTSKLQTSHNLKLKPDHTLTTMNESESWDLERSLKLVHEWSERPMPIQNVLDSAGQNVNFSDVPTPIPDGYVLEMGSCRDNMPFPRESALRDFSTACNHHDMSTCATATTLFRCPSYCINSFSCVIGACAESCELCG